MSGKGKPTPKRQARADIGFDGLIKTSKRRNKRRKTKFKSEIKRRRAQRKKNISKGNHI